MTPPTIIAALITIRDVTRSTSRGKSAAKISEKNGLVLLIGMTAGSPSINLIANLRIFSLLTPPLIE
jgi:hypothetical protein